MGNLQRVDSLKMAIPSELLTITKESAFKMSLDEDVITHRTWKNTKQYPGLNQIAIGYGSGGNTQLQVSAKLLGNDYAEGINKNNIENAFEIIKKWGHIDFDNAEVLNHATVRGVDVFKNINVNEEYGVGRYVDALKTRALPPGRVEKTTKWGKQSVVWRRQVKSYKERMIAYDKVAELMKAKNKDLLMLHDKAKIMGDYENVLRFEMNTDARGAFRKIRERFNISDNNLSSVLESETNVLWNIYQRMVNHEPNTQLKIWDNTDETQFESWKDAKDEIGLRTIVEMYDGNFREVKEFMMKFYSSKSNPTREIDKIRLKCQEYHRLKEAQQIENASHLYEVGNLVSELESKLLVA